MELLDANLLIQAEHGQKCVIYTYDGITPATWNDEQKTFITLHALTGEVKHDVMYYIPLPEAPDAMSNKWILRSV